MVKVMEDSYICALNIFFDDDNGKEVSQFAKNHFIKELELNKNFKNNKIKDV